MSARPWVAGWWGTARLRLEVFDDLDGIPVDELAHQLGVSVGTLRRYRVGDVTPLGGNRSGGPLDALARLVDRRHVDLLEFRPIDEGRGQRDHASWSPCPPWCDAHELLVRHQQGLPGEVDVLSNRHLHQASRGPLTVTVSRYGDADPADPWSRTFVYVKGLDDAGLPRCTGEDLRWLGEQLATLGDTVTGGGSTVTR